MPFPVRFPGSAKKEDTAYSAVEIDANRSDTDVSNRSAPHDVPGWPAEPQRIASAPIWIIADFLLLFMPIAFIALAALAYRLDGKELSNKGRHIQEAILLGPTLFPLAFAALGGRSLKKIALWKAERGTTLGFLEHVIGSQSLVATVGHAITLHSLNILTIGLLLLWALSPLGGQSALRLVRETNTTSFELRSVFYADVDAPSNFPASSYNEDAFNRANAVLMTSLMTVDTLEREPVDTWNHPKVPRLEELEQAEDKNDTTKSWYAVDHSKNQSYASLAGIDIINLSGQGATNFTVPYEYMYFGCNLSPQNNFTKSANQIDVFPNQITQLKYLNGLNNARQLESGDRFKTNSTSLTTTAAPGSVISSSSRNFFIYTRGTAIKPEALIFGSSGISTTAFYLFECSMKSVLVEANIICESDSCGVERLRRLNKPRSARNATHLPYDVINQGYTSKYLIRHLVAVGGESLERPNPVDAYIYGNGPWQIGDTGMAPAKNWSQYINDPQRSVDMSHRLTRVLNTFWDASRWPVAITRNDPFALNSLNGTTGLPPKTLTLNATEAIVTRQVPVYRANAGWVACLVICSSILLLLGIFSFFLSLRITAPDIFDYVSSFTRDNPYIQAPQGGSGLDGAERARLLRKLPVQLGDADAGAETGYIAIRSVDGKKDCQTGRVRRDRMYR
ncbi:hypothetical protein FB567DRAFT_15141 [Paraphoma chrysanthemicola]|uniref:Uncharacterized protein n=1 Tax=Paraphoma chrysanthemicola TaxID=798071 RepID=A0A8K0RK68_9PLEO|nr:hypothetical protein FB567DRAFT_15141 [Paraphoma chrysanthemicola]